jgi:predicted ATP-dependent protease
MGNSRIIDPTQLETGELAPEDVLFSIRPDEIAALDDGSNEFQIIGQQRAIRALEMAVQIPAKGYNLFATGMSGTGKRTTIKKILSEHAGKVERLRDIGFVYNFHKNESPRVLYFPAGRARAFREQLGDLVLHVRHLVQGLVEKKPFKEEKDRIILSTEDWENQILTEFEKRLNEEGFTIVRTEEDEEERTDIFPVYGDEVVGFEDLQEMLLEGEIDEADWNRTREKYHQFFDELKRIYQKLHQNRIDMEQNLDELRIRTIDPELEDRISSLKRDFPDPLVQDYLDSLREDMRRNLRFFVPEEEESEEPALSVLSRYDVNVVVDHTDSESVPIIFEGQPDYSKLFGSQEVYADASGEPKTGFMMLRAGSVIQANGGYLVLRAEDIIQESDAWNALKRVLQDGRTEIRHHPGPFPMQGPALKPEPVTIDLKVIIMGNEYVYDLLYLQDEEFQKLFKVPAEFDSVMVRDDSAIREYLRFMRMITRDEGLLRLDYDGMARVIEYGVRLAEFRSKLSTRFSMIADLIREAHFWAKFEGKEAIDRDAVIRAINERNFLHNLPEEKIDEQLLSGELLISVHGSSVGRINGLAVIDRGYYAFGRPVLITARSAPGTDGVINIEREAGLSGEIHDKGIYILEGFLQSTYATDFPLSVRASLAFEQSYVEVDGDSASSAEVYALLSSVAQVALRQDIAVTGSVNQMGQVQPVGGISEKIEGFYLVCKKLGLTGKQGVVIPAANRDNLLLSEEVQEAIVAGRFHIYSVTTVNEGLAILTGMNVGEKTDSGTFPPKSFNGLVESRLRQMAHLVKDFGSE